MQISLARRCFEDGRAVRGGKGVSRILREHASFEKRQGNFEVQCLELSTIVLSVRTYLPT